MIKQFKILFLILGMQNNAQAALVVSKIKKYFLNFYNCYEFISFEKLLL